MSDAALRDTPHYLTEAEYVALEKASPIRHEFVDGAMYAMTGTSKRHNLVTCRFTRRLADAYAWRHDRAGLPARRDARRGLAARPLNEPGDATAIVQRNPSSRRSTSSKPVIAAVGDCSDAPTVASWRTMLRTS